MTIIIHLDQTLHSDYLRTKIRDTPLESKTFQIIEPFLSKSLEDVMENIKFLDMRRDWLCLLKFMNERNSGRNPFHNVSLSLLGFKFPFDPSYRHHASEMAIALGKALKDDSNFIFQIVAFWPQFLVNTNERIRDDKEIVLRAAKRNGGVLYYVSYRFRDDREVVMAAVKQHGSCLQYASERLKRDREIVLESVKTSAQALFFSHESLRNDKNIVLEAIRNSKGHVMGYMHEPIKDKEFFSEMLEIKRDSFTLNYLARLIKDDKDLALIAVKYDGLVIKYMDEKLQKDKEIAFQAVNQNPKVFHHIDKTLKSDEEFILKLAKNNPAIIQYLSKSFTKDPHFMSQLNEYFTKKDIID